MRNRRHIVPRGKGWAVVKPGSKRASSLHRTQSSAIRRSRQVLRNSGGGENVIHSRYGKIRDADTVYPGNDPFPPRG